MPIVDVLFRKTLKPSWITKFRIPHLHVALIDYCRLAVGAMVTIACTTAGPSVIAQTPDLTVQLKRAEEVVLPALTKGTVAYDVIATNVGSGAASHVFVITTLPLSWSFQTTVTPNCFFSPGGFVVSAFHGTTIRLPQPPRALCNLGQMASAVSKRLQLIAKAPSNLQSAAGGAVESKVFKIVSTVDPDNIVFETNEDNNTAEISTEVQTAADLDAGWSGSRSGTVGQIFRQTAHIRNIGDRDAENVTAVIDLPGRIDFDRYEGGDLDCDDPAVVPNSGNLRASCRVAAIAVGDEAATTFRFRLKPTTPNDMTLNLTLTADPLGSIRDHSRSNNVSAVPMSITAPADLTFDYLFDRFDPPGRDFADLLLHVSVFNYGPAASPPTRLQIEW